jgi:hypothetical protein
MRLDLSRLIDRAGDCNHRCGLSRLLEKPDIFTAPGSASHRDVGPTGRTWPTYSIAGMHVFPVIQSSQQTMETLAPFCTGNFVEVLYASDLIL